jgi:HEPN domain-containing protein
VENKRIYDIVRQWIVKADSDMKIGMGETVTQNPATDMICFHMQQCAEKYLKAYLVYSSVQPPRTHDIDTLLAECAKIDDTFNTLDDVAFLSSYAVGSRYPDEFYIPDLEETRNACDKARMVKEFILTKLEGIF